MFSLNSYVIKGLVLKRVNTGEADRILTIFTYERGKIRALGKGLRKLTSHRSGSLEIFNLTKVRLVRGKTLDIITEAETLEGFRKLRRNLSSVGVAYQMVEIVDKLSAEGVENREVFHLLVRGLEDLDQKGADEKDVLTNFAVGVLRALGFWPRDKIFSGDWQGYVESVTEYPLRAPRILTRLENGLKSN